MGRGLDGPLPLCYTGPMPKRKDEKEERAIAILQQIIDMDLEDRDALPGSAVRHVKAAMTIMKKRRRK